MWVYFIIIFLVGAVIGFVICVLASMGRQREYEEKLWEVERLKWRLEHESRKQQDN